MSRRFSSLLAGLALAAVALGQRGADRAEVARFRPVDVFVDSGTQPLAAYQLHFQATAGDVKIVGIEGGEHAAFVEPPYYDPKAIQREQVILAAFSTLAVDQLPTGRTRIATIHVRIAGETAPQFEVTAQTAASADGERLTVTVTCEERKTE